MCYNKHGAAYNVYEAYLYLDIQPHDGARLSDYPEYTELASANNMQPSNKQAATTPLQPTQPMQSPVTLGAQMAK